MSQNDLHSSQRNIRLDFFRGIALLVIFINHVPGNELALYTPSRFGLSDSAEIFVFLSGYAAAIAYARSFQTAGFALGSFRVFHRCSRIYAAHLGLFALMAMMCVLGNRLLDTRDYVTHLNIRYFFDQTEEALGALMSLRYVPNYFDILPMYLVVMLWIPAFLALSRVHSAVAMAFSVCVYLAMWALGLEFSAEPYSPRPWFFNPFGWQLIFFIGVAFGLGWLKTPSPNPWLVGASLCLIALALPFSPEPALRPTAWLQDVYTALQPLLEKTRFGPLRLLHFLALAYLMMVWLRNREHWLQSRWARSIVQIGRLSLPIFVVSMALSYIGGMVFDLLGHGRVSILSINLGGVLLLALMAHGMAWIKSNPWKMAAAQPVVGDSGNVPSIRTPTLFLWEWVKGSAMLVLLFVCTALPVVLARKADEISSSFVLSESGWVLDAAATEPHVLGSGERLDSP